MISCDKWFSKPAALGQKSKAETDLLVFDLEPECDDILQNIIEVRME